MHGNTSTLALGITGVASMVFAPALALAAATAEPNLRIAYIDPGSGSFILQALIATAAGAAVAINAYWGKIKRILGIGATKAKDDATDSESTDA